MQAESIQRDVGCYYFSVDWVDISGCLLRAAHSGGYYWYSHSSLAICTWMKTRTYVNWTAMSLEAKE